MTNVLELRWSGIGIEDWWRNELDTNFTVTAKATDDMEFGELYIFKWTTVLIPPTSILVLNLIGVVAGFSDALNGGYKSRGPLFGKITLC
ncbi:hypothetical protein ABZP36_019291 [Zizania latifolia]